MGWTAAVAGASSGQEETGTRAVVIFGGQIRARAFTLACADALFLSYWAVEGYLLFAAFMRQRGSDVQAAQKDMTVRTMKRCE